MKTYFQTALLTLVFYSTSAFAASGAEGGGSGWAIKLFFAFLAAIIVLQLIPALVLFGSMVAAVFRRAPKEAELVETEQTNRS
ncbi:MAG: hypothetical protein JSV26_10020 [bacterium]|nr:MAG: hypothetical protein JSV26_10020 [bacterium]